uniref:Uncharacterized protein n=1 Tax=Aureoumbra lagunensis TaxID=44058 RepID=A0A7S3JN53_9STRA|mmetsp:Transcript_17880/g.26844  ORF Transcript_17880/g.26844 Transcript_17880/m.26844 type:complete len:316 (-) Transcript_17880:102-1049(-)
MKIAIGLDLLLATILFREIAALDSSIPTTAMGKSLAVASALKKAQGCWAGWEVNFDVNSGKVKPLGSMWLPEDLREWGQAPLGWQIFCRDEIIEPVTLKRTLFRVEPEAGCAADEIAASKTALGIDLEQSIVAAPELGNLNLIDTCRYPSGEMSDFLKNAPPFVEARTYFYYMQNRRVRFELKLDPSRATLITCTVADEHSIDFNDSPFAIKPKIGSSRITGFDASTVYKLSGKCFAPSGKANSSIKYSSDGSTSLTLADGRLSITLTPNESQACSLDLKFSSSPHSKANSFSLLREYDALGNVLAFSSCAFSSS